MGICPTHKGLSVDPCIPEGFGDFRISRRFRDAVYNISVETNGKQKGAKELLVDGCKTEGNVIPFEAGRKVYNVTVIMG